MNLNYEGYEDYLLVRTDREFGGIQYVFKFDNGYGASVVKGFSTYGAADDLWELAVLHFDGDEWSITYNTPITDDVIGYLTDEEVGEYLEQIKNL